MLGRDGNSAVCLACYAVVATALCFITSKPAVLRQGFRLMFCNNTCTTLPDLFGFAMTSFLDSCCDKAVNFLFNLSRQPQARITTH